MCVQGDPLQPREEGDGVGGSGGETEGGTQQTQGDGGSGQPPGIPYVENEQCTMVTQDSLFGMATTSCKRKFVAFVKILSSKHATIRSRRQLIAVKSLISLKELT